jgi:transcription initiation factor IIF auxiliary subunit
MNYRAPWWTLLLGVGIAVLVQAASGMAAASTPSSTDAPKINNYARFVRELQGVPFFHWRVFVDEPAEVLATIAEVQYELHPSFDDPIQLRRDPTTQFALERGGWGEFRLPVTIRFKDGKVITTTYRLDFRKPWPESTPP